MADVLRVRGANGGYRDVARAREEVAELVEGDGHDAVGRVERFFHAVAVVDVDVDVQHAREFSGEKEGQGTTLAAPGSRERYRSRSRTPRPPISSRGANRPTS